MFKKRERWKEKLEGLRLAVQWTYHPSRFLTITIFAVTVLGGLIKGSHQEFLEKNGLYAKLFRLQAKGYQ